MGILPHALGVSPAASKKMLAPDGARALVWPAMNQADDVAIDHNT
jgi:hypothetical protein